jgi:hypothetical protein
MQILERLMCLVVYQTCRRILKIQLWRIVQVQILPAKSPLPQKNSATLSPSMSLQSAPASLNHFL